MEVRIRQGFLLPKVFVVHLGLKTYLYYFTPTYNWREKEYYFIINIERQKGLY